MKYLGIDYGTKKVGLAISEGTLPYPYKNVDAKLAVAEISRVATVEKIEAIVIGQPSEKISEQFDQFVKDIKETVNVKLIIWDETLSSQKAQKLNLNKSRKRRKQQEHAIAASLILEDYLENKGHE